MTASYRLLKNASLFTPQGEKDNQAIVILNDRIDWCGENAEIPQRYLQDNSIVEDCKGQLITPGLIDCHTHLVYAGNRFNDFKCRLLGATYTEIAKNGGGILSTVAHTREASFDQLLGESLPRALAMRAEGVTTLEIKSGYGLDLKHEIKMLQVAKEIGKLTGLRIKTTFLGAHAVPVEFKNNSQAYVDHLCQTMLPEIAQLNLADAVDVFCESIAFSYQQTEQIFLTAKDYHLPIKCHADQLTNIGASALAAKFKALSCDHLEYLEEEGANLMAKNDTVAVLLPGAFYFLREQKKPPVDLLRQKNVKIALATDCNPGSSPTTSLRLVMSMACQFFSLTVQEAILAVTAHAAQALGIQNEIGKIAPGFKADLVRWSVSDSTALCYYFGHPVSHETMIAGNWLPNQGVLND